MPTTNILTNSEELPVSKTRRREGDGQLNWSDLPDDVLGLIISYLLWIDRIRIRAVCKGWSIPIHNIPASIAEVPWAMEFCLNRTCYDDDQVRSSVSYRLLDPTSRKHIGTVSVREENTCFLLDSTPLAFKYGWVLYRLKTKSSLFLYSPFTDEIIELPECSSSFQVATFSLSANSPNCFVFLLWFDRGEIGVCLCSPGDKSWKSFLFKGFDAEYFLFKGLNAIDFAVDATYANGVFYCVFDKGQLGGFDVGREEWSLLCCHPLPGNPIYAFRPKDLKLISYGVDLRVLCPTRYLRLVKFDFSNMRWSQEYTWDNHILFTGRTSFCAATVGETSELTNTIFSSCWLHPAGLLRYGSTFYGQHYQKCCDAKCEMNWIELPTGGLWRANDLISAMKLS